MIDLLHLHALSLEPLQVPWHRVACEGERGERGGREGRERREREGRKGEVFSVGVAVVLIVYTF